MAIRSQLELCSGIGGLGLGVNLVTGARTVGHCEREAHAAAVLVALQKAGRLDPAPIWDDLATFDGRPWRGRVDCITAGFPCQPFSVAGSKRGADDPRHLWPAVRRVLLQTGAPWAFFENVRGLLSVQRGDVFGAILADLAEAGFDAEWDVFSAAQAGAPHRRERVFLLARRVPDPRRTGVRYQSERGQEGAQAADERHAVAGDVGAHDVGDADRRRLESEREQERAGLESARWHVADRHGQDGGLVWPPGPGDDAGWRDWIAAGRPEPAIRRDANGLSSRVDRLRALGNAVVPQQAALAFKTLYRRLIGE